jgi:hypothetical protein
MRCDHLSQALILSALAVSCGSSEGNEKVGVTDGGSGTSGTGGAGGSGGSSGSPGGSAGDAAGGSTGSSGTGSGGTAEAGIDAGEVNCVGTPQVFPEFDRACWDDSWCAIGFHQTDCCGNRVALGMLHPEVVRFDVAEQICRSQYPGCGCPAGPATTDTGQTATDDSLIKVACRAGACTTYVP